MDISTRWRRETSSRACCSRWRKGIHEEEFNIFFADFDTDKNGFITKNEMRSFIVKVTNANNQGSSPSNEGLMTANRFKLFKNACD